MKIEKIAQRWRSTSIRIMHFFVVLNYIILSAIELYYTINTVITLCSGINVNLLFN